MPKLEGPFKLTGTLGDVNFFKRNGKYYARSKGGVSAQRMRTDPAFARTRENQKEFVQAVQMGKFLRKAFRKSIQRVKPTQLANRLSQILGKILRTDTSHLRGERVVASGDLLLLENLEINTKSTFDGIYYLEPDIQVDRANGNVAVDWPAMEPYRDLLAQPEATHVQLYAQAVAIDFTGMHFQDAIEVSTPIPLTATSQAAIAQSLSIPANTTDPILVLLGIEYVQDLNGQYYPLRNGAYNALTIHTVDV